MKSARVAPWRHAARLGAVTRPLGSSGVSAVSLLGKVRLPRPRKQTQVSAKSLWFSTRKTTARSWPVAPKIQDFPVAWWKKQKFFEFTVSRENSKFQKCSRCMNIEIKTEGKIFPTYHENFCVFFDKRKKKLYAPKILLSWKRKTKQLPCS